MPWSVLYVLDAVTIGLFAISYYRTCYRKGYRIDFWHAHLFLGGVLPNLLMLPFARSELNALILGKDFASVIEVLPKIFLITLLGYFASLAGGSLWGFRSGLGLRKAAVKVLDIVPRCSMMLMSSWSLLVFQTSLCLFLQVGILGIYFASSGFGFDLRDYTFANPTLRPVAQIISSYSILIASHSLARYVETKERVLLACTLLLTIGLVFFGARSNLLNIYLSVLLCYLIRLRTKVSLFRIMVLGGGMIAVAFYLGRARAGQYSLTEFFGAFVVLLLYGNNFSDLRDFAWVYAKWDHVLWEGKTYLAALFSFVPRFASEFRDTWGLGVATGRTIGVDPQVHPGVRPGLYGEGLFNFGLLGVIAVGLLGGIILRRLDIDVKRALAPPRPSMRRAFASTMLLSVGGCIAISANLSTFYVICGIYFFSWLCLRMGHLVRLSRNSPVLTVLGSPGYPSLKK